MIAALTRRQIWEQRAEWPLTVAALVFLGFYAAPILQPEASTRVIFWCRVGEEVIWLVFVVDYLARLYLSTRRKAYIRNHLVDLLVIILPFFRPLQALRLFLLLSLLNRYIGRPDRAGRLVGSLIAATSLTAFIAALAVLAAERGAPGGNILSFGDALWWTAVTISTVGYGDHYPVTGSGQAVAVALMLVGVGLLTSIAATMASWLIQRISVAERSSQALTQRDLEQVLAELKALRDEVAQLRSEHSDAAKAVVT